MATCVDPPVLAAFARGELADGERDDVELHVDTCTTCRLVLSEACRRSAAALPAPPTLPVPGDAVGRYTIGERLGEGAMGVVFAARDAELERDVAVKLLRPQPGAFDDALVRERMLREGRALARIDHGNVVRVLDIGEWRGSLYVVMERLAGITLRAWLATPRAPAAVRDVLVQCARGLAAAHAAEVVHRDVNPDNIIVGADGRARITDFGLALVDAGGELAVVAGDAAALQLTQTRAALGTPAYMAPEQLRGDRVDARANQFAWCVVAVEAATGERPFRGATVAELLAAIEAGASPATRDVVVGSGAAVWSRRAGLAIARGLVADPARRWPTLEPLVAMLTPPRRRRWPFVAVALATLAIAGGAAVVLARGGASDSCDLVAGGLDADWFGPPAARVGLAFAARGAPGAPEAWRYVAESVARYAVTWRTSRADACRAAQPAVADCLNRRRDELAALVARWTDGAPDALAEAPQAIDALAPPAECATPELDAQPIDAGMRARFAAARADRLAGRTEAARGALDALAADLAARPAQRAQVLTELAGTERELGRVAASRDHFVAAVAAAEAAGASRAKLLAWLGLAELAGDDTIELAQARDAVRLAGAVLERIGNPESFARRLDVARGIVAMRAGDPTAAVAALSRAVADHVPPTELSRRLQILARAQLAAGRIPDALASLERAGTIIRDALGPDAADLTFVEDALSEPLDYLGRHDEAIAHGERALALLDANFGRQNPRRATVLGNLAVIHANAGHLDRAIALDTELVALATDDYRRAIAELNLGSALTDANRAAEAEPHVIRGRDLLVKALGDAHPLVANAETALAAAAAARSDFPAALNHARRALAIREQTHAGPGYLAHAKYVVAQLLVATGHRADGLALARDALTAPLAATGREAELAKGLRAFLAKEAR